MKLGRYTYTSRFKLSVQNSTLSIDSILKLFNFLGITRNNVTQYLVTRVTLPSSYISKGKGTMHTVDTQSSGL